MTESYTHADAKSDLYWSLLLEDESVYAEVEKGIGRTRTDILTDINNHTLAIEIQHTRIPIKSILRRMTEHTLIGAHTLWLITPEALYDGDRVRNLNWVRFIQTLQGGMIFLPSNDKIIPARVDNSFVWKGHEVTISSRKLLEEREPIALEQLKFEHNDYFGVNTVTFEEWWIERDYELV
jgi:hypothetical protein